MHVHSLWAGHSQMKYTVANTINVPLKMHHVAWSAILKLYLSVPIYMCPYIFVYKYIIPYHEG